MVNDVRDVNEHLLMKGAILLRSGGEISMAVNILRFHAWPSGGAVVLRIEFGDEAQVTMELGLAEVEELLKVIDEALGPGVNNKETKTVPDC